jgi:hypothetical protein
MTIPAGAGSESAGSQQQTHVRDDDDPGMPDATGNVAAGGARTGDSATGDSATGGSVTDARGDEMPEGLGSAGDTSSTGGGREAGRGRETSDTIGADDPSGI